MTSHTADGKYSYTDMAPNGYTLLQNARLLNRYLARMNGWSEYDNILPGMWGTDINVCRIGHALIYTDRDTALIDIARAAHDGWSLCYKYWLEYEPWIRSPGSYHAPHNGLYSNRKPLRALQVFDDLPFVQKNLYRQIASFIKYNCY